MGRSREQQAAGRAARVDVHVERSRSKDRRDSARSDTAGAYDQVKYTTHNAKRRRAARSRDTRHLGPLPLSFTL